MKILSVNNEIEHKNVTNSQWKNALSFWEYDIIILDIKFSDFIYEYDYRNYNGNYGFYKFLNLKEEIQRRKAEIDDALTNGSTIFCFTHSTNEDFCINYHNDDHLFILKELGFDGTIEDCQCKELKSNNKIFQNFIEINNGTLSSNCYLSKTTGAPILLSRAGHVLGVKYQIGKGNLIFIPNFTNEAEEHKEAIHNDQKFIGSLIQIYNSLKKEKAKASIPIPEWFNDYYISNEKTTKTRITKYRNLLKTEEDKTVEYDFCKRLLIESGLNLEDLIFELFKKLDIDIKRGRKDKEDLIIEHKGLIGIIEIKGLNKTGDLENTRQLDDWVRNYNKSNLPIKGILIVNAYKDTPLSERPKTLFTEKAIEFSKLTELCLISSMQLVSWYIDCKQNSKKIEEIINEIFKTIGIFDKYSNWENYIKFENKN